MARVLSANGILVLVQAGILLIIILMMVPRFVVQTDGPRSHLCLRAERSPAIHPGCHYNKIEKVNPRETRGDD